MTASTWVVVADSSAARFFSAAEPTGPITELEDMAHPEGRMAARELTSDLPGRAFDSVGQGRHAMESEVGPRQQEAIEFANLVARRIEKARVQGEADRVALVAPPDFLGLLRKALTAPTKRMVVYESDHNYVRLTPREIRERLPERLYETPPARS